MKVPVDGAVIRWQIIATLLEYANERERLVFALQRKFIDFVRWSDAGPNDSRTTGWFVIRINWPNFWLAKIKATGGRADASRVDEA